MPEELSRAVSEWHHFSNRSSVIFSIQLSGLSQRDHSSYNNTNVNALITLDKTDISCMYDGKFHLISSQISLACIVWGPVSHSLLSNGWVLAPQRLAEPGNQSVKAISSNKWVSVHCLCLSQALCLRDRHSHFHCLLKRETLIAEQTLKLQHEICFSEKKPFTKLEFPADAGHFTGWLEASSFVI